MKRRSLIASAFACLAWPFKARAVPASRPWTLFNGRLKVNPRCVRRLVYQKRITRVCVGKLVPADWNVEPMATEEMTAIIADGDGKILFKAPLKHIVSINESLTQVTLAGDIVLNV